MAFRFRRSMKLGKGVRLNVSKKGVGMSVGKTGMRYSMHSTGSQTNTLGIPGTGLSYVNQRRSSKQSSTNRNAAIQDIGKNEAIVEGFNDYLHAITHLHEEVPPVTNWKELYALPAPFDHGETGPEETVAMKNYGEYKPTMIERVIKPLANKHRKALQNAIEQAREQDRITYENWQTQTELATRVLEGDPEAYQQVIEANLELQEAIERGLTLRVLEKNHAEVEIQVNPSEVVPDRTLSLTKAGNVSKKKMGKTHYYKITKDFVCGYTLWVARAVFASLPVESCTIHAMENSRSSMTGRRENKVLLSVQINQQTFNALNFNFINPADAMDNFPHHMTHLKTKGFRAVERMPSELLNQ